MKTRKRHLKTLLLSTKLVVGLVVLLLAPGWVWSQQYEAYYNYLGTYPNDANPGWHEKCQGVANDQDNWFITQVGRLWKIPASHNLHSVSVGDSGVVVKRLSAADTPELTSEGYNHLGDPDYYEFGGQGYILVPLEESASYGGEPPYAPGAIAAFRADNLQYIDHAVVSGQGTAAGWCAVDLEGDLYSSAQPTNSVNKFAVAWDSLRNNGRLILSNHTTVNLSNEMGASLELRDVQGGDFSPSGRLLYLSAGDATCHHYNGLHVFDLSTGRRVRRSTNGSRPFNFEFSCDWPPLEEPQGLTIWDLDDGRAPGIRGQLHVILLDVDVTPGNDDDIFFSHFTHTIYVDRVFSGIEVGTPFNPFNTVAEAYNYAWDGARIKIQVGSYPETLTLSKKITLLASGGTVTIGR